MVGLVSKKPSYILGPQAGCKVRGVLEITDAEVLGNVDVAGTITAAVLTAASTVSGHLADDLTVDAGVDIAVASGDSKFDYALASGIFRTGSGEHTLNGNVTISGSKTLTTGTGKTTVSGALDVAGAAALKDDVTITANKNLVMGTAGSGTGFIKTGTGVIELNGDTTIASTKTLAVTSHDKLTVGGYIIPQEIVINERYAFGDADKTVFIAPEAYEVVSVTHMSEIADTSGSAATIDVMKCTGTQAPHSGTSVITAACDAKTVTQVVTAKILSATVQLAAGNRLALDFTGLTDGVGIVMITLKRI